MWVAFLKFTILPEQWKNQPTLRFSAAEVCNVYTCSRSSLLLSKKARHLVLNPRILELPRPQCDTDHITYRAPFDQSNSALSSYLQYISMASEEGAAPFIVICMGKHMTVKTITLHPGGNSCHVAAIADSISTSSSANSTLKINNGPHQSLS